MPDDDLVLIRGEHAGRSFELIVPVQSVDGVITVSYADLDAAIQERKDAIDKELRGYADCIRLLGGS